MKLRNAILLTALSVIGGCSTVTKEAILHKTKYVQTHGSWCDLYIQLNGQWVRFYEEIGDYNLIESPDGKYLVITDFRGSSDCHVEVYDIEDQKLYDISNELHNCLPSLSKHVMFSAHRFVDNYMVEFGIFVPALTFEERPIAESLRQTVFTANVEDLIAGQKYR